MKPYAMIADLDPATSASYKSFAAELGLETLVMRDGKQAIGAFTDVGVPRILLTDLSLPGKDGFQVIAALRKLATPIECPALVISAFVKMRNSALEKKDGEAVLKATVASLKARGEGRGEPWSVDSSKKEEGGEAGEQFRQVLGKAITVKVREGKAVEVSGLPEPERREGGGGQGFAGFRAREIVGRRAVERPRNEHTR